MAIVVEDGSIVTGANSYISTAGLSAYATARNYTLVSGAETLLIQAMDYLEAQNFKGYKLTQDQALQWPRSYALIDGYYVSSDEIPQALINAQCEIAMAIDAGNGPLADIERATIREKVDVIEVEYSSTAAPYVINRKIKNALQKLLAIGGSGSVIGVGKG